MRTKEDILKPHVMQEDSHGYDVVYEEDALKAMDEYAKEVALKFSEYWGQITPEQLQYFIIEKGTPEPIVQYKTREEVFDEWISKYLQETSKP